MYKSFHFLPAAVLSLTSVMAMEMDAPEETTGWNHLPRELQQVIIDQLNAEEVVKAAQVTCEWRDLAKDERGWKNRVQNDFQQEDQVPPIEG
ncbi:F-box-like domain-containing protein [Candidatus Odyssella thessalonicensis]|uniref:F-box-like domain-containing protein n=1 Tax=Candidatus Odyssella thessalonicensis TaxID=84647 RepID=UPI000225B703|nr:F-box-like domain-containing protein [Candidatus Odyssella thessalonicensis]